MYCMTLGLVYIFAMMSSTVNRPRSTSVSNRGNAVSNPGNPGGGLFKSEEIMESLNELHNDPEDSLDQEQISAARKREIQKLFNAGNGRIGDPIAIGEIIQKYRVLSRLESCKGATQQSG